MLLHFTGFSEVPFTGYISDYFKFSSISGGYEQNKILIWIQEQENNIITVEKRMKGTEEDARAIYGILAGYEIDKGCVYVENRENFYSRMIQRDRIYAD